MWEGAPENAITKSATSCTIVWNTAVSKPMFPGSERRNKAEHGRAPPATASQILLWRRECDGAACAMRPKNLHEVLMLPGGPERKVLC
jgi:hypothetical protein